jgi:hypothetical protein
VTAAQQAHQAALAELADAEKRRDDLRQAASLLAEALEKLRQAQAAVPADAELVSAVETLAARADRFTQTAVAGDAEVAAGAIEVQLADAQQAARQRQLNETVSQLAAAEEQLSHAEGQCAVAAQQAEAAEAAWAAAAEQLEERWARQAAMAPLKPLTPEQLAWSIMQATGVVAVQRAASEAELKQNAELVADPARFAVELEKHIHGKLEGYVADYVRLFGGGPGQPQGVFFATVDQALFFANGGNLRSWLAPAGENLTARLLKLDDARALADELYLSVLSRPPSADEARFVAEALGAQPHEKAEVVQELAWALLTSAEFRFSP